MAVYTPLTLEEALRFTSAYPIGALTACEPIAEGIENSNFLLKTSRENYILTLFEKRVAPGDLPFFMALMQWLSVRNIVCPQPLINKRGQVIGRLKAKPAAIVTFLPGKPATTPTPAYLAALGEAAAQLHAAGQSFPQQRENPLSLAGWHALAAALGERAEEIAPGLSVLLAEELNFLDAHWPAPGALQRGAIHADLFPDNIFFEGEKVSGIIDFYFACTDAFAYDLAICLNAWCFDARQQFLPEQAQALFAAYQKTRSLQPEEKAHFLTLARGAALRFLLTRSYDWLHTPVDALVTRKDPLEYLRKLEFFRRTDASELGLS